MALLQTPEKQAGFHAVDFKLKNIDGRLLSLADCRGPEGIVIMFICNHCPYVKAVIGRLVETCKTLQNEGYGCVAIMPNDTENYPADSFDNMKIFAKDNGFTFPYLIDETQQTAKSYDAVCTPDFFGFDRNLILQYRGRLDSAAAKAPDSATVPELMNALLEIKQKGTSEARQFPSMGCSIKWKT
ncbi:MAG: thioredoxin family protein [Rhodospirillales bacterium]|nr:thioredoxin family protein [Alphaproteobacteria bacterium]MCB1838744.1 thioredoxin family protein [Alphaproteobacteria bacterium]MCB9977043.1 thioredoxin family protein [Rhodospirillales bacterium]